MMGSEVRVDVFSSVENHDHGTFMRAGASRTQSLSSITWAQHKERPGIASSAMSEPICIVNIHTPVRALKRDKTAHRCHVLIFSRSLGSSSFPVMASALPEGVVDMNAVSKTWPKHAQVQEPGISTSCRIGHEYSKQQSLLPM